MRNLLFCFLFIFFTISCNLTQLSYDTKSNIKYPNKNELWKRGDLRNLQWDTTGLTNGFNIDLYLNGNFVVNLANNVVNTGNKEIKIPENLNDGIYQIKFTNKTDTKTLILCETPDIKIIEKFNWLFMFYGSSDNNLESYIYNDINEIEASERVSKAIKTVALIDRSYNYSITDNNWSDTRVYEIGYDVEGFNKTLSNSSKRLNASDLTLDTVTNSELDMGNKQTLSKFISYCYTNYPAYHYILVIASHGSGFRNDDIERNIFKDISNAVSYDEGDNNSSLNMNELKEGLSGGSKGNKLDILAFDACNMGMIEVAYQIKDFASILISSSYSIPTYGYPYYNILNKINLETNEITPQNFASIIVKEYYTGYSEKKLLENKYYSTEEVTLSAIDLTKIDLLASEINNLAGEIISNNNCADLRFYTQYYTYKEYADIGDFASKTSTLYNSSSRVKEALSKCIISYISGKKFPNYSGLSIFFPVNASYISDKLKIDEYNQDELLFAKMTPQWVNLINRGIILTGTDKDEFTKGEKNNITGYGNDTGFDSYYNINNELTKNTSISSFIYYPGDEDWYFIKNEGYVKLSLTSPQGTMCKMFLYTIESVTTEKIEILPLSAGLLTVDNSDLTNDGEYPQNGYLLKITGNNSYSTTSKYSILYE